MQVGFKIALGNFNMLEVMSSEHARWEDCMAELYEFLTKVNSSKVENIVRQIFKTPYVKKDEEEEL